MIYIYIYIYISVATLAYFCYSCPTPPSINFSSQPVVRGPKVSHHKLLLRDSPLYSTDWQTYLVWCFFCKQSRYYIICSLVNTVDKIIFFPFKSIEEKEDVHYYDEKNMFIRIKKLMTIYTDTASSFNFA